MLTICLATIPPRHALLPRVLDSLLAQTLPPDQIIVSWCRSYRRLPGTFGPPDVPRGVTLFETVDIGPLTKLAPLPGLPGQVAWCDDDALFGPGWLKALRDGRPAGHAAAASGFALRRLRRSGITTVVQGFAGVLCDVQALDGVLDAPESAIWADDIWISGVLAAAGVPVALVPDARRAVETFEAPRALQDDTDRTLANQMAADAVHQRFGIWPPLEL